jgi:hypothetical protein
MGMKEACRPIPSHILFRVALSKTLVLFAYRLRRNYTFTSEDFLAIIRKQASERRRVWEKYRPEEFWDRFNCDRVFPLDSETLEWTRGRLFYGLSMHDSDQRSWAADFYSSPARASLADLLFSFVEVGLEAEKMWSDADSLVEWMELMGEWMLQAAVEAYLTYRTSGWDTLREIFAFGYVRPYDGQQLDPAVAKSLSIFRRKGHLDGERDGWAAIRRKYLEVVSFLYCFSISSHLTRFS